MLSVAIKRLLAQQSAWVKGMSLSLLDVSPEEYANFKVEVVRGLSNWEASQATSWGAAMLLVGAREFREHGEEGYDYATVGRHIGLPALASLIHQPQRDAMEQGARLVWGVRLLVAAAGRQRLCRSTMVLHGGGSPQLLVALCEQVPRRWAWASLLHASEAERERFLLASKASLVGLASMHTRAIDDAVVRPALCARLEALARVRQALLDECLVNDDEHETHAALVASHGSLRAALECDSEELAKRLLATFFSFQGTLLQRVNGELVWHWLPASEGGDGRLVLRVPNRLPSSPELAGIDRFRLLLAGASASQSRPVYGRTNDGGFVHLTGPWVLELPRGSSSVDVVAEHRVEGGTREVCLRRLDFPGKPVALFAPASGSITARVPVMGDSLAVVVPPSTTLRSEWGKLVKLGSGFSALVGRVPEHSIDVLIGDGEDERRITLKRETSPLTLELRGGALSDVRIGRTPVLRTMPIFSATAQSAELGFELVGPAGQVVSSGRRTTRALHPIRLATPSPGLYTLRVTADGHTHHERFFVAPGLRVEATSAPAGTSLRASWEGEPLALSSERWASDNEGVLNLPPEVHGSTTVDVCLPAAANAGTLARWTARIAVRRAVLVVSEDGTETTDRSIARLRHRGGILVTGAPGEAFTVHVGICSWTQLLDGEGRRFFPLALVPPEIVEEHEHVHISVSWGAFRVELPALSDETRKRPRTQVQRTPEGWKVTITVPVALGEDVRLEAVPAWRMWHGHTSHDSTSAPVSGGVGYEATVCGLDEGPYIVTLMQGAQRASGMALVRFCDDSLVAPESLPPLEHTLWGGTDGVDVGRAIEALAQRLGDADREAVQDGLLRCFERYGARWFALGAALPACFSQLRLLAFLMERLEEGQAEARRILYIFEEAGTPWCAVRMADLEALGEALRRLPVDRCLLALQELAALRAGLIVPLASLIWSLVEAGEQNAMALLRPWANLEQELAPLKHDALETLLTPGAHDPVDHDKRDARFAALLEARKTEAVLREDGGELRRLLEVSRNAKWGPPVSPPVDPRMAARLPDVDLIDRGVFGLCMGVHGFRQGQVSKISWDTVRKVARRFPRLVDYWLCWLSSRAHGGALGSLSVRCVLGPRGPARPLRRLLARHPRRQARARAPAAQEALVRGDRRAVSAHCSCSRPACVPLRPWPAHRRA